MMDSCLQDARSVLQNEQRTLEWLRNKTATIPHLRDLYCSAADSLLRFNRDEGMQVFLRWEVLHTNGDALDLHIGGLIQLENAVIDNATYYLCIAHGHTDQSRSRVLRKFHFDYANSSVRGTRQSSVFHLQYAGKLPSHLRDRYDDAHLDSWLEEPRIFFLPMSLSLIMHMAFREFPDEYTNRLCEDGEWRSVFVQRDQQSLVVPFLEKCLSDLNVGKKLLWEAACEP